MNGNLWQNMIHRSIVGYVELCIGPNSRSGPGGRASPSPTPRPRLNWNQPWACPSAGDGEQKLKRNIFSICNQWNDCNGKENTEKMLNECRTCLETSGCTAQKHAPKKKKKFDTWCKMWKDPPKKASLRLTVHANEKWKKKSPKI